MDCLTVDHMYRTAELRLAQKSACAGTELLRRLGGSACVILTDRHVECRRRSFANFCSDHSKTTMILIFLFNYKTGNDVQCNVEAP